LACRSGPVPAPWIEAAVPVIPQTLTNSVLSHLFRGKIEDPGRRNPLPPHRIGPGNGNIDPNQSYIFSFLYQNNRNAWLFPHFFVYMR
jgi:hypothetical protein